MVGITTQSTFYVPSAQVLMPYRHFPFNIQHELNTILPVLVTTSDTFSPPLRREVVSHCMKSGLSIEYP